MASEIKVDKIQNVLGTQTLIDSTTGNLKASEISSYDNTTISFGNDIKLPTDGGIKDSGGVDILRESGGHINMGNMRLPTTGGISDSTGYEILTASNNSVTLAHNIINGTNSYGFMHLKLFGNKSLGSINWDTLMGDGDNIEWPIPGDTSVIRLVVAGVYIISYSGTFVISGEERSVSIGLYKYSDSSNYSEATDSVKQADSGITYGNAAGSFVGHFDANTDIYFSTLSADGSNASLEARSHADICLIRRTS